MFMPVLECELGDARFIELAQTFRNHRVVLFFRCPRKRQIETELFSKLQRDTAVFGGMGGGEKTTVIAILHVLAVGLQDA